MAIDERLRHQLFTKLEKVLGHQDADTLMSHLPPVGWADVATKSYVDTRLEVTEHKVLGALQQALHRQTLSMMGFFIGIGGLLVAALKLL